MMNIAFNVARLLLCVLGLVIVQGCTTTQDNGSSKPWTQIGAEEDRAQRLNGLDWDYPP